MNGIAKTVKERVNLISKNDNLSLSTPFTTCKIELTGICTLKCKFCYNSEMAKHDNRQHLLSEEYFDIALDYINNIGTIKEVGLFYMGESGIHPMLPKFYKKLKDNNYFTYLTTNGTCLDNVIKAIPYIDSLKVSFNYMDDKDFVLKTGRDTKVYNTILNNVEKFACVCHNNNKELTASTVLDTDRAAYSSSINLLKKLGVDRHYFIPLQTQGGTKHDGSGGVIGEADNPVSPVPCWSLFKGIYIDCDLNVRTCCYGHEDKHILGNLLESDIESKEEFKRCHLLNNVPDICKNCICV